MQQNNGRTQQKQRKKKSTWKWNERISKWNVDRRSVRKFIAMGSTKVDGIATTSSSKWTEFDSMTDSIERNRQWSRTSHRTNEIDRKVCFSWEHFRADRKTFMSEIMKSMNDQNRLTKWNREKRDWIASHQTVRSKNERKKLLKRIALAAQLNWLATEMNFAVVALNTFYDN